MMLGHYPGYHGGFQANPDFYHQTMMPPRYDNTRAPPIQQHQPVVQQPQNQQAKPTQGNYKTRPCRHFELGKCRLAGLCNFAHGQEELNYYIAQSRSHNSHNSHHSHRDHNQQPSRPQPIGSENKIIQLEKSMEDFELQQKSLIWKLKQYLHSISDSPDPSQIQAINQYFLEIYNTSTDYLEKVGNLTGLQKGKNQFPPQEPVPAHTNISRLDSQAKPSRDHASTVKSKEEPKIELSYEARLKNKLKYILNSLIDLYPSRSDYFKHFNDARKNLQEDKLEDAAQAIEKILMDESLDDSLKMRHNAIVEKARKLDSN